MPHSTKTWKLGMPDVGKTLVKMKVSTAIMTRGLSRDQKTPSDMFR